MNNIQYQKQGKRIGIKRIPPKAMAYPNMISIASIIDYYKIGQSFIFI
jgi:hypothetical protein